MVALQGRVATVIADVAEQVQESRSRECVLGRSMPDPRSGSSSAFGGPFSLKPLGTGGFDAYIAKVFRSGNSQAVRLPKEFRFDVDEVEVSREGDALILRQRPGTAVRWASLRAAVARGVSPDFMAGGRDQPAEQHRPALDRIFE